MLYKDSLYPWLVLWNHLSSHYNHLPYLILRFLSVTDTRFDDFVAVNERNKTCKEKLPRLHPSFRPNPH